MLEIFYYLLIALGVNILMFIPAYLFKTDKLTDLSYSFSFVIVITIALLINGLNVFNLILTTMVILWGLRLGTFLFIRIRNMKRDKRFDGIRESFVRFLRFWLLQGLGVWIILLPALFFMQSQSRKVFLLGGFIWAFGLMIESIADLQKYSFKQIKANRNKFIQQGLWRYSRHPNYFGEILCWIGIYLFVFISLSSVEMIMALLSPAFIIIILLFVTGIPPLEKKAEEKWGGTKEYREYKRKTNLLIPWLPK